MRRVERHGVGLVAPGYEMARIAARQLLGDEAGFAAPT
jgi:NAD(P)H-nitrite reductase large subunit